MIDMERGDQVVVAVPAGVLALTGAGGADGGVLWRVVLRPADGGAEREVIRTKVGDHGILVELLRLAADAVAPKGA